MQDISLISDELRLLEHIVVVFKFPGQATYPYRIWWMLYLRNNYRDNTCLEIPQNLVTQPCLWEGSAASETILINANKEKKFRLRRKKIRGGETANQQKISQTQQICRFYELPTISWSSMSVCLIKSLVA